MVRSDRIPLMPALSNTYSLQQLFHERVFTIPDYQRGYAWRREHVREFLEDLDYLDPNRHHYTGTVVLHARTDVESITDENGTRLTSVDVVDGQQRLTTIVILLDCVRRALVSLVGDEYPFALGIERNYVQTVGVNGQSVYKINLNSDINDFFRRNVLGNSTTPSGPRIASERRLEVAKKHIDEHLTACLSDLNEDDKILWLQELHSKVVNGLQFSLYQVEAAADVGIIFEVMNDRGKQLTELEKVKNYLLYSSAVLGLENELADQVNSAWGAILQRLMQAGLEESNSEDDLLRVNWLIDYDHRTREWKRINSVKKRFNVRNRGRDGKALLEDLTRYTQGLRDSSVPFCDVQRPAATGAFQSFEHVPELRKQVVEWSAKLLRLGNVANFLTFLCAVRLRYPRDAEKYLEAVKFCELYAFRVFGLGESRSDAGSREFNWAARRIRLDDRDFNEAMQDLRGELRRRCDDTRFDRLLNERTEDADWYHWGALRYFLYEYESWLAAGRGATPRITWEDLDKRRLARSIEHVLPQSIDGVQYWQQRFPGETSQEYLGDLGNLAFTRYNASLGNKPFTDKAGHTGAERSYANSAFFQEQELADVEDWTPEAIIDRRERLLAWARERWAVDLSDAAAEPEYPEPEDDDELDELEALDDYDEM